MEEFDYELNHIKGDKNSDADLLSRNLSINTITIHNKPRKINSKAYIESNNTPNTRNTQEKRQNTAYLTLLNLHKRLGHPGLYILTKTLSNYINVKNYIKIIKNICLNCMK
ncbi:hypothetical protein DMUE_5122, partial [Dictyocoela muelleri]